MKAPLRFPSASRFGWSRRETATPRASPIAVPSSAISPIRMRSICFASHAWSEVRGERVYAFVEKRTTAIRSDGLRSMKAWMTGLIAWRRFRVSPSFS